MFAALFRDSVQILDGSVHPRPPFSVRALRWSCPQGQVVARPMMYLALTYDHRLIDGREAVTFLKSVAMKVEDPTRLLLDL